MHYNRPGVGRHRIPGLVWRQGAHPSTGYANLSGNSFRTLTEAKADTFDRLKESFIARINGLHEHLHAGYTAQPEMSLFEARFLTVVLNKLLAPLVFGALEKLHHSRQIDRVCGQQDYFVNALAAFECRNRRFSILEIMPLKSYSSPGVAQVHLPVSLRMTADLLVDDALAGSDPAFANNGWLKIPVTGLTPHQLNQALEQAMSQALAYVSQRNSQHDLQLNEAH